MAALGFGALTLFWLDGTWSGVRPGHPDYRSAIVGDGLLLPVFTGLLVSSARTLRADTGLRGRRWVAAGALLGLVGGVGVQWAWWSDPDPRLNWTLTAPHVFSAPGWYHAVFLTATSALVSGTLLVAVRRLAELRAQDPQLLRRRLQAWPLAVLVGTGLSFVATVALDSAPSAGTSATVGTVAGLVAATGAALVPFGLVLRGELRHAAGRVVQGVLLAGAVTSLVTPWPSWPSPAAAAAAAAALAAAAGAGAAIRRRSPRRLPRA